MANPRRPEPLQLVVYQNEMPHPQVLCHGPRKRRAAESRDRFAGRGGGRVPGDVGAPVDGHADKGQSLTEFALLLPLLLLIVMGTLDLGRGFSAYITVINASREGARYGAMYPTDTAGITTHATREATGSGLTLSNVSITCPGGSCTTGNPIQVTVRFTFQLVTTSVIGLGPIAMQSSTQMVVFGQ